MDKTLNLTLDTKNVVKIIEDSKIKINKSLDDKDQHIMAYNYMNVLINRLDKYLFTTDDCYDSFEVILNEDDMFLNDEYSLDRDYYLRLFKQQEDDYSRELIRDDTALIQVDDFYNVHELNIQGYNDYLNDIIESLKSGDIKVKNDFKSFE